MASKADTWNEATDILTDIENEMEKLQDEIGDAYDEDIQVYSFNKLIISDALTIESVIGIGHYRPLFLVSVSAISERCNRM